MSESDTNWVRFTKTHWTTVMSAGDPDSPEQRRAMQSLCQSYWPPVYAYIRQQGHDPADAQDLAQEFFARCLEKDYLRHLTHRNGKFRSFLLACVNHLLSDERDRRQAQKRGGGMTHIPIEAFTALEAELSETDLTHRGEVAFDRMWARTVLQRASAHLANSYRAQGKVELFEELRAFAAGVDQQPAHAGVAARLNITEEALRAVVHRMRKRFGELIRNEVGHTLAEPGELEAEIRYLIDVVSKA
jgi:RNA polymerase sigma-70 factor (ECF subfamily)